MFPIYGEREDLSTETAIYTARLRDRL